MAEQLPIEIDFERDDEASVERMNKAMTYLFALYSTVAGLRPDYEAAIAQIQTIGLQRLTDALQPIFVDAETIAAQLATLRAAWLDTNVLTELQAAIEGQIQALADNLTPRTLTLENGQSSLQTTVAALAADRWYHNHG